MATEKTPTYKRIKRAEEGRDDWKSKALLRREENEKLKYELKAKEEALLKIRSRNLELEKQLRISDKKILEQDKTINNLKKKSPR